MESWKRIQMSLLKLKNTNKGGIVIKVLFNSFIALIDKLRGLF